MKTRDILETLYGQEASGFGTRLADIAEDLVQQYEEREARRLEAAQARDALAGKGPLIDALANEIRETQRASLTDNRLPALTKFDAYCRVKDASKEDPKDRGLKMASRALYDIWMRDPYGSFTVGEIATYREHFEDSFPKSAVKKTLDDAVLERGFQTLTNLPLLTRIASQVTDQETYDSLIEANGLDGDSPQEIRARTFIMAMANFAEEIQDSFEREAAPSYSHETVLDRVVRRYAQEEEMMEDGGGAENPFEEMDSEETESQLEDESAEFPHEEGSEEMTTVESPISGDELVLELGVSEEEGSFDGLEPDVETGMMEPVSGGESLPDLENMSYTAQIEDGDEVHVDFRQNEEAPDEDLEESDVVDLMSEDPAGAEEEDFDETLTFITDPSSGQELQVTLAPVKDEKPEDMKEEVDDASDTIVEEMNTDMTPDDERGRVAEHHTVTQTAKTPPSDQESTPSAASSMKPCTDDRPNMNPQGELPNPSLDLEDASVEKEAKKTLRLTAKDVQRICADRGITSEKIEEDVLDGKTVVAGRDLGGGVREWGLYIENDDNLHLARYDASGGVSRIVRQASLVEFDEVVSDFMALTAATIIKEAEAKKPRPKAASPKKDAKVKKSAYEITTEVPEQAPINARRMMATVWKVVPEAEGEMLDDGRLSILISKPIGERELNRIARVLQDVYGVREMEAQAIQPTAPLGTQSETPEDSPYQGAPPVPQTPAGQPGAPMQAPMQTPAVGAQSQQDFIQRHTVDPLQQDPTKVAQLDTEEIIDDTDIVEEDPDVELDEEPLPEPGIEEDPMMDPGLGDPSLGDPGMGAPGLGMSPPVDPMMGGGMAPGMGGGMAPPSDASQMPLDLNSGQLMPEDQDAVRAAMQHYRNTGLTPLEGLDKFMNAYGDLLDKYGDQTAPERAMAEAAVVRAMTEAWQQPSVIPMRAAGVRVHAGEIKAPKVNEQQPDAMSVNDDMPEGDFPEPSQVPAQQVQQGDRPETSMAQGLNDPDPGSFGAPTPSDTGQDGSRHVSPGEKFSDVSHSPDMSSGENEATRRMEEVSHAGDHAYRSTKKADVIIRYDDEMGAFEVYRHTKRIASRLSDYAVALADAERRTIGTDGRILLDEGDGTLTEI